MFSALQIARFFLLLGLFLVSSHANADKRVALVIGNSAYEYVPALANPKNDAEAISIALERLDFQVIRGIDLDHAGFVAKIKEYTRAMRGADIALLYFAGHGLQVRGLNYLAPVDTELIDDADLEFETIRLDTIMSQMERERRTNLVFLDACRNNPLTLNLARTMGTRSLGPDRGLAPVETGVGTLVAYSTQPGNVAFDGTGMHSPFTGALLKHLEEPGTDIAVILRKVRQQVLQETDGKQVPWSNSSLTGPVVLREAPKVDPMLEQRTFDLAYWESIRDATDVSFFENYLDRFPEGQFADLANLRIATLRERKDEREELLQKALEQSRQQQSALQKLQEEKRDLLEERKQEAERLKAALDAANLDSEKKEQQIAELNREKDLLARESQTALALQEIALEKAREDAAAQLDQLEKLQAERRLLELQSRELTETQKAELEKALAASQQIAQELEGLRTEKNRLEQETQRQSEINQAALAQAEKEAKANAALIASLETQAKSKSSEEDSQTALVALPSLAPKLSPEEREESLGMEADDRRKVQALLAETGYGPGAADGVYGERTRLAIRELQRDTGVLVTGYLDSATISALSNAYTTAPVSRDGKWRFSLNRETINRPGLPSIYIVGHTDLMGLLDFEISGSTVSVLRHFDLSGAPGGHDLKLRANLDKSGRLELSFLMPIEYQTGKTRRTTTFFEIPDRMRLGRVLTVTGSRLNQNKRFHGTLQRMPEEGLPGAFVASQGKSSNTRTMVAGGAKESETIPPVPSETGRKPDQRVQDLDELINIKETDAKVAMRTDPAEEFKRGTSNALTQASVAGLNLSIERDDPDFSLSGRDLARRLQEELNRAGCEAGPVDGIWGDKSQGALERLVDVRGLKISSLKPETRMLALARQHADDSCAAE